MASLRARVGGRWAISWQGFLLGLPFALMFTYFSSPAVWASSSWAMGLLNVVVVGTVAYSATGAVLWLAGITLLRHRRRSPAPVLAVALVGGIAWTARSAFLIGYLESQGLPSGVSPATRLITGFIQGVIAIPLTAWLLGTIDDFYTQRKALLGELVREELASEGLVMEIEELRADLRERVHLTVTESVDALAMPGESEAPSHAHVQALREVSDKVARGVARDLWRDAERSSRLNPLAIVQSAAASRPFSYWGLVPTFALALIVLPLLWSWPVAVPMAIGMTAFALVVSLAANRLVPRLHRGRLAAYALAVAGLFFGSAMVVRTLEAALEMQGPSGAALPWIVAMNFGVMYPCIGLAAGTGRTKEEVLLRLRRSITEAEIRRESLRQERQRVRRDLATALHGGVQAHLMAAIIRLRQGLDAGDASAARSALEEAKRVAVLELGPHRDGSGDLRSAVDFVADVWAGIVDITADVQADRAYSSRQIKAVEDVLLEGINNAVSHAEATHVDIRVVGSGEWIRVVVVDNGRGVNDASRGLGSAMLDSIASKGWSLVPAQGGGSALTAQLRVGEHDSGR